VRAVNIRSSWPDRLSFTVVHGTESQLIQTQLCGAHWVYAVLSAIAVGITAGMRLPAIAEALQRVEPFRRRLSPVERNGITFVRDDWKASLGTIPAALRFMKDARAARKIVVIGTISDYGNSNVLGRRIYPSLAAEALESADHVVFIGPQTSKCLKARRHADDQALQAFFSMEHARDYLLQLLRPGDLVLLKGSR
jgi:UDP-N-acetylmuramyl pentapeptide synthase